VHDVVAADLSFTVVFLAVATFPAVYTSKFNPFIAAEKDVRIIGLSSTALRVSACHLLHHTIAAHGLVWLHRDAIARSTAGHRR